MISDSRESAHETSSYPESSVAHAMGPEREWLRLFVVWTSVAKVHTHAVMIARSVTRT